MPVVFNAKIKIWLSSLMLIYIKIDDTVEPEKVLSNLVAPNQPMVNLIQTIDPDFKGTLYENFILFTKNDINLQLLKKFNYKTEMRKTPTGRDQTVYICTYQDCGKEFLRTCNLLDHARMHQGIKPNL